MFCPYASIVTVHFLLLPIYVYLNVLHLCVGLLCETMMSSTCYQRANNHWFIERPALSYLCINTLFDLLPFMTLRKTQTASKR